MIALNLDGGIFHHVSNGVLLKGDFSDATLNNRLTVPFLGDKIAALSSSLVTVRFDSRKNQQMPVKARLIYRLRYSMQKIIYGERLFGELRLAWFCCRVCQPKQHVHRPIFDRIKRCSLAFNRDHTMPQDKFVQQTNTQAQAEQHHPNIIADNMARPLLSEWVSGNQEGD
jgi:hypothetical protein